MTDKAHKAVWITRAQPGAQRTADAVVTLGLTPVVAPVMTVVALTPALPKSYDGVIFTSRNAVHAFSALTPRRDAAALCVGDATAEAAKAYGFTQVHSAASDADGLHALICDLWPRSRPLLYAAPSEPSAPVADRLRAAGFTISETAVYATRPVTPDPFPEALATTGYVLLHSARAARQVAAILTGSGANLFSNPVFLCLSETVASALRHELAAQKPQANAPHTAICRFPDEASMLDLLKGLTDRPN